MLDIFMSAFVNSVEYRVLLLFIIGACIGSFINVVIYRLPIMLNNRWKLESEANLGIDSESSLNKFNLLTPDSSCPNCKNKIKRITNIPLFGYFISNGKCTSCSTKISIRYPVIELLVALLFAYAGFIFTGFEMLLSQLFIISSLCALIIIDYDTYLLPDEITLALVWFGLLINLNNTFTSLEYSVIGAVLGYFSLWSIFWIFKFITQKEGMGYGDFKLYAACGACFGVGSLLPIIILASLSGSIIGICLIISKKINRDKPIPFGPFLGIAALFYLFHPIQILG